MDAETGEEARPMGALSHPCEGCYFLMFWSSEKQIKARGLLIVFSFLEGFYTVVDQRLFLPHQKTFPNLIDRHPFVAAW